MRPLIITGRPAPFRGKIFLPGDKSITHRFIIISSLSSGTTTIKNFPFSKDCLATLNAFGKLGIKSVRLNNGRVRIYGRGRYGLEKPKGPIFVGDSGTTLRLILGVLAGQNFAVKLIAGKSLSARPMLRVTKPLREMGATISARKSVTRHPAPNTQQEEYPPVTISGGNLRGISYRMLLASAQVKSALLLAGLYAKGKTQVIEPVKARDHTERALRLAGAAITTRGKKIILRGGRELKTPGELYVPGDISSASFFMVLAAMLPDSKIRIENVGLNPSRLGIVKVLKRMGAKIQLKVQKSKVKGAGCGVGGGEPVGDIVVRSSVLKGTVVKKGEVPSLIDELPILMVAASLAKGKTVFNCLGELRLKETDRVASMQENLRKMQGRFRVVSKGRAENVIIDGVSRLKGASLRSFQDHRTAMSMIIAALAANGESRVDDVSCIAKSFPTFLPILKSLIR